MSHQPGLHHELVLIDQPQLRHLSSGCIFDGRADGGEFSCFCQSLLQPGGAPFLAEFEGSTSIHRIAEKGRSRKPAQPRSYRPRIVRCYPRPIGPAPSVIHRASESLLSRKPGFRYCPFSETGLPSNGFLGNYGVQTEICLSPTAIKNGGP